MRSDAAALLAHQGGWDEALMVLAPLLVFAFLLYLANRRAAELQPLQEHEPEPTAEHDELDSQVTDITPAE